MTIQLKADAARQVAGFIESWLTYRCRLLRVPGFQAAVVDETGLVAEMAGGYADVEAGTEMTPGHLFRIASHSKTFTATVTMQLVEEGVLRLDDPLGRHLPRLAEGPAGATTLRELLSHTGGLIRDGRVADWWQLSRPFPDHDQLMALAGDEVQPIEASTRFKYSNIGFSLIGEVIAAATGSSYNEQVRSRVIEPLLLADTDPELNRGRLNDYAVGYSALGYAEHRIPIDHVDTRAMSAATGFSSTAGDVCRYAAAHFDGDDRLLTDLGKRMMRQPAWPIAGGEKHYGLGFETGEVAGVSLIGHGGGYPGHSTRTLIDPAGAVALSVFTNAIDGPAGSLADGVIKLIAAAGEEASADEACGLSEDATSRFCGRFASLWGVVDLVRIGDRLMLVPPSAEDPTESPTVVVPDGEDRLRVVRAGGYGGYGEQLRFSFAPDGSVESISGPSGISQLPIDRVTGLVTDLDRVGAGDFPSAG